jgi:hypothetical protein
MTPRASCAPREMTDKIGLVAPRSPPGVLSKTALFGSTELFGAGPEKSSREDAAVSSAIQCAKVGAGSFNGGWMTGKIGLVAGLVPRGAPEGHGARGSGVEEVWESELEG